jgi:hypothetical protein
MTCENPRDVALSQEGSRANPFLPDDSIVLAVNCVKIRHRTALCSTEQARYPQSTGMALAGLLLELHCWLMSFDFV